MENNLRLAERSMHLSSSASSGTEAPEDNMGNITQVYQIECKRVDFFTPIKQQICETNICVNGFSRCSHFPDPNRHFLEASTPSPNLTCS